jgi:hypothetical protein
MKLNTHNPKDKRKVILKMYNGKALSNVGECPAILLPIMWARMYAWEIDGAYWVSVKAEKDTIIISPIDKEAILHDMEVNSVKPNS